MKAPERLQTTRLLLRKPNLGDAESIFNRYSSDDEVTRFLGWPKHKLLVETKTFLEMSEDQWTRWPAGPYVVESRENGTLLGGTGFAFETPFTASTGYVFAKDAWGKGYATETLNAIVDVARDIGIIRLYALCHTEHPPSRRVLEKCGFDCEGILRRHTEFPNLPVSVPCDVFCYSLIFN